MNTENKIEKSIQTIIDCLSDNPDRPGLKLTPERVRKSFMYLTSGYREEDVLKDCNEAIFKENVRSNVVIRDIEFYSLCEHHLLPFWGTINIAFKPNESGEILGLSKFARIVDLFSKRFQVQERLVHDISSALMKIIKPQALCVEVEARHMCMMMRGIKKQNSKTITYLFDGDIKFEEQLQKLLNK